MENSPDKIEERLLQNGCVVMYRNPFLMESHAREASEALEIIGLHDQAARFRELLELMPAPCHDEDERLQQVIAIQEEDPDRDAKIQDLQWLAFSSKVTDAASVKFVRECPEDFEAT